jgi:hypothetical protein
MTKKWRPEIPEETRRAIRALYTKRIGSGLAAPMDDTQALVLLISHVYGEEFPDCLYPDENGEIIRRGCTPAPLIQ